MNRQTFNLIIVGIVIIGAYYFLRRNPDRHEPMVPTREEAVALGAKVSPTLEPAISPTPVPTATSLSPLISPAEVATPKNIETPKPTPVTKNNFSISDLTVQLQRDGKPSIGDLLKDTSPYRLPPLASGYYDGSVTFIAEGYVYWVQEKAITGMRIDRASIPNWPGGSAISIEIEEKPRQWRVLQKDQMGNTIAIQVLHQDPYQLLIREKGGERVIQARWSDRSQSIVLDQDGDLTSRTVSGYIYKGAANKLEKVAKFVLFDADLLIKENQESQPFLKQLQPVLLAP